MRRFYIDRIKRRLFKSTGSNVFSAFWFKVYILCAIAFVSYPSYLLSQTGNRVDSNYRNLLSEKILSKSFPNEQFKLQSKSDVLRDKESRTLINKTVLENGFLLIEQLTQRWDDSSWVNSKKSTYTYDGNNNRIEELDQDWGGSNWVNRYMFTYTYDVNNNLIELLIQDWDGSNWISNQRWPYTYDVNNNLIELLGQYWNGSNWVNHYMFTYTYDVNNNLIEDLYQLWFGSNWVNSQKDTYTYDMNNNRIEELNQDWRSSNWKNDYKFTYIYDVNNNRIEELNQDWGGSNWVNEVKHKYTYDGNNNLIEDLRQNWDGSNWVSNQRWPYTYDVNNNLIEELHQLWDGSNWINYSKTTYTHIITGIEKLTNGIKAYSLSNNYPNPFNPSTSIQYAVSDRQFVTLKVYDVLGNEVASLVNEEKPAGSYEVKYNAANLPSGIYFYRLQAGSFIETNKMVLLK